MALADTEDELDTDALDDALTEREAVMDELAEDVIDTDGVVDELSDTLADAVADADELAVRLADTVTDCDTVDVRLAVTDGDVDALDEGDSDGLGVAVGDADEETDTLICEADAVAERDIESDEDEVAVTLRELDSDELLDTLLPDDAEIAHDALTLADSEPVTVLESESDALPLARAEVLGEEEVLPLGERDVVNETDAAAVPLVEVDDDMLLDRLLLDDSEAVDNALPLVDWDPDTERDSERDALMLVVAVELNVIEAVADEVAKSAGEVELLPLDEND